MESLSSSLKVPDGALERVFCLLKMMFKDDSLLVSAKKLWKAPFMKMLNVRI